MENNPLAMGLDLSLKATGLIILNEKTNDVLFQDEFGYSLSKADPWYKREERVYWLSKKIVDIILKYAPNDPFTLCVEGPSLGSKGAQVFFLGELRGRLNEYFIELLDKLIIDEVFELAPTSLKKFTTGNGKSNKPTMAAYVQKHWNKIFPSDNLTDAYSLCQAVRAMHGHQKLAKVNMLALEKVVKYVKNSGNNGNKRNYCGVTCGCRK